MPIPVEEQRRGETGGTTTGNCDIDAMHELVLARIPLLPPA
jgi:hypothetical protein